MNLLNQQDLDLRYLFLDLNSYFASVEQQEHPELRNKPVAVVPVMADTSFVIAASYEAKAFGVKTGTRIGDAKRMCPEIILKKGSHTVYTAYHNRIIEVLEDVLPVDQVCSIDEMRFRLLGEERLQANAIAIAQAMKRATYDNVGECMNCSIGIAANSFLAKLGTEITKPNGLEVIRSQDLPARVSGLKLTDFAGINKKMLARLNGAGIFDVAGLYAATPQELRTAFGSVMGEKWWYLIRGHDIHDHRNENKTLGHSHVLAPSLRNDEGVKKILLRLLHKAAARLRSNNLAAKAIHIGVRSSEKAWETHRRFAATQDTIFLTDIVLKAWQTRDFRNPKAVAITFVDLVPATDVMYDLFDPYAEKQAELSKTLDGLNQNFGKNTVYLAGLHEVKNSAPERIAFNKTWLFQEGKGDNDWQAVFAPEPATEEAKDEIDPFSE